MIMAFCANCGTKMEDGAKFCPACGTPAGGAAPAKPAAEKVGTIRKCPACGAEAPAMTAVCPSCGHEFTNAQVSSNLQSFLQKLETIENEKEKLSYINNFPVPNTKEDILEFGIMAASQITPESAAVKIFRGFLLYATLGILHIFWKGPVAWRFNKAWRAKIKQVYTKGQIALNSDKAALAQVKAIVFDVEKMEKKSRRILVISLLGVIAFYGIYFTVMASLMGEPKGIKQETQKLEALYNEIVTDVNDGNLPGAKLKAAGLFYGYDSSGWDGGDITKAQTEVWDKKRDALLKEIETLQAQKK
jgi:RNA polymerase subunit RPABC4/transcription elongation factor Spt4